MDYLALVILTCLWSFIATVYVISAQTRQLSTTLIYMFMLAIVSGLAVLNSGKIPESDLETYLNIVLYARGVSLQEFIAGYYRDQVFYVVIWALAQFKFLSAKSVIITISSFSYWLLGAAIIEYGLRAHIKKNFLLPVLISVLLLPVLFSLSLHLVRQFSAASIYVFLLAKIGCSGPIRALLPALLSGLVHISAVAFIITPAILKLRNLNGIWFPLTLAGFFAALFTIRALDRYALEFVSGNEILTLLFRRISETANIWEVQPLSAGALGLVVALSLLLIYVTRGRASLTPRQSDNFISAFIIAICCCMTGVVIPSLAEVSLRYLFYLYFLVPFFLLIFIERSSSGKGWIINLPSVSGILLTNYMINPSWQYSWTG